MCEAQSAISDSLVPSHSRSLSLSLCVCASDECGFVLASMEDDIFTEIKAKMKANHEWLMQSNMLTIKGKMGKFEVLKNGTLFIQKANIKDQGQYICLAQNEYGSDKLVVTLSVVAYPTRILEEKMRDIKVLAGKTVHLECRTEGRPVPIVSWILPNHTKVKGSITEHGRVTVTTMGTLTIQKVSVLDRGHYKCIASNPAGTDTATVRLQVVAAPPAILEEKRQLVRAEIGQNLFLACSTYGDPRPTTYWVLHDGTIVQPVTYSHTKVSVFGNGTLYLRDVQITESGKYECIATSSTGSERRVVTLVQCLNGKILSPSSE
uniref:Immunoglobulin superfamily member 10 n=1 Tax=Sinocyclocheilus grahami TaxID=75366 RepID=A0A672M9V8_SINGR